MFPSSILTTTIDNNKTQTLKKQVLGFDSVYILGSYINFYIWQVKWRYPNGLTVFSLILGPKNFFFKCHFDSGPDVLLGFLKQFIESPMSAGRLLPVTFLPARVGGDSSIHLDSVCKYTSTSLYRGGKRFWMAQRLLGFSFPFNSVVTVPIHPHQTPPNLRILSKYVPVPTF